MDKVPGKLLLLLVVSLVFTGCAHVTGAQLSEERRSHLELQRSVINLTNKVDALNEKISLLSEKKNTGGVVRAGKLEKVPAESEIGGLGVIEAEEGNISNPASLADVDILESPGADKLAEEIVEVQPTILASFGTFLSPRKKQSPKEDYEKAYNLYKRGDFKGAISDFSSFIASYPSMSYTDNAFYWRGECYYSMGEFRKAIDEFDEVEKKFPKGNKAPDAMLKRGFSYIKIKKIPEAKNSFRKVMDLYPFSIAAKKAAEKINSL